MTAESVFGAVTAAAAAAVDGPAVAAQQQHKMPAAGGKKQFPAGLRILVVDDDILCLKIISQMLRACDYEGKCPG